MDLDEFENYGSDKKGMSLDDFENYGGQPEKEIGYAPIPGVITEPTTADRFAAAKAKIPELVANVMPTSIRAAMTPEKFTPKNALATLDAAAAVGSRAIAEPIAGIAGIGRLGLGGTAEQAESEIEAVRKGLSYDPRTELGKEKIQASGEMLAPVGEVIKKTETMLGDTVYEETGSATLAALATTLPTATIELLGLGAGKKAARASTGFKKAPPRMKVKIPGERRVTKSIVEAAPDIKQIKNASRAVYKEIDDMKFTVKPTTTQSMAQKVIHRATRENVDEVLTPKSARVVQQLKEEMTNPTVRSLTDLDQLRRKAQIAAAAPDPSDARVGAIMVDEIDDFIDSMGPKSFSGPQSAVNVGERFKVARKLWGRARRAELINEAFTKADLQASGFENGIRTQLRQILNNRKRARYFTKDEIAAMTDVVKGTSNANVLKLVGRLGFSEGGATNVLGGLVGMGVLGPAAPVVGQVSRKMAQVTTLNAAKRMESLIRGGGNGRQITRAYLQSVPKAKRNMSDLSDLLLSSGADVDDLLSHSNRLVKEAAEVTRARKLFGNLQATGTAVPAIAIQQDER